MKQHFDSGKGDFMFSSSSTSSSSGSYTPLGNKNKDDCYSILPSLQTHKKKYFQELLGLPVLNSSS
jgi:hypothetical protein